VLDRIGADNFNISVTAAAFHGNLLPSIARQLNRIAGIRDNVPAQAQVVSGHAVSKMITLTGDVVWVKVPQGLLDGVKSQIGTFELLSHSVGYGRLSRPRQAGK
jgi:hypothetical protein